MASHPQGAPPIALVKRRLACENTKLRVYFDHIREGRKEVANYMVVEPLNVADRPLTVTGVSILPLNAQGQVGLQSVWRHPIESWTWEVPRGFVDAGETPAQAALRELQEEAGLRCADADLIALGSMLPEGGVIRGRGALFAATRTEATAEILDDELGLGGLQWFALREALAMADRSEIEDSSTLTVLYRWARHPRNPSGR